MGGTAEKSGWTGVVSLDNVYVKIGSSQSGTDERGKCESIGLSAACPSNEATICSMVAAVA